MHHSFPSRLLLAAALSPFACSEPPPSDSDTPRYGTPLPELSAPASVFTLLWEDDFDTFDATRWGTGDHTFQENNAQFSPEMVTIENGMLRIGLEHNRAAVAGDRPFLSGEARTHETFTYGRFVARVKFAAGSGVVSSLFTFYDHWSDPALEENWNELDIEFLGGHPDEVHFNVLHWASGGNRKTYPIPHSVGYDVAAEFHTYAIEWLPDVVHFYIDDQLAHSQTVGIKEELTRPQKLMMNVWPVQNTPGLNQWAGEFGGEVPTAAYYDWIKVYSYTP